MNEHYMISGFARRVIGWVLKSVGLLALSLAFPTGCTEPEPESEVQLPEFMPGWNWAHQPPVEASTIMAPRYSETAVGQGGRLYFLTTLVHSQPNDEQQESLELYCFDHWGKKQWSQSIHGQLAAHSLSVDNNGDLWTGGVFANTLKIGEQEIHGRPYSSEIVIRFDGMDGTPTVVHYSGEEVHNVFGRVDSEDRFWLTGKFGSMFPSDVTELMFGRKLSGFLTRMDRDGNELWSQRLISSDFVNVTQMRPGPEGSMILCGAYEVDLRIGEGKQITTGYGMEQEGFLAKVDSAGETVWIKSIGSIDSESYTLWVTDGVIDCLPDEQGGLYFTGKAHDRMVLGSDTLFLPESAEECYLAHMDGSGAIEWGILISGEHDDGSQLALDPDGNVWVTGVFSDTLIIREPVVADTSGQVNVYLAQVDSQGEYLRHEVAQGNRSVGFFRIRNLTHTGEMLLVSGQKPGEARFGELNLPKECRYYNSFVAAYHP